MVSADVCPPAGMRFSSAATHPPVPASVPTYKKKSSTKGTVAPCRNCAIQSAHEWLGRSDTAATAGAGLKKCANPIASVQTATQIPSPRIPILGTSAATRNGQATAPTPHEKFSRLTAAATLEEGNCVPRKLVVGFVSPYPKPFNATQNAVSSHGLTPTNPMPNVRKINPAPRTLEKPNRGNSQPVAITPTRLTQYCAGNNDPACASLNPHCFENMGNNGPRLVVITPITTNPACSRNHSSCGLGDELELEEVAESISIESGITL